MSTEEPSTEQPSITAIFKALDALFESRDFTSLNYKCSDLSLRLDQVDQLYRKRTDFPTPAAHDSVALRIINKLRKLGKKVAAGQPGNTTVAVDILYKALHYAAILKNPSPPIHLGITDEIMRINSGGS